MAPRHRFLRFAILSPLSKLRQGPVLIGIFRLPNRLATNGIEEPA